MTSAYTAFDAGKPNATTQSIVGLTASANANDVALWYAVVHGSVKGFALSISGGTTEEPLYYVLTNGAQIVRATNTWSSGYISQQVWEVSQDTGSSYAAVATQTFTYDGTTGAPTATTNAGGMSAVWYYVLGRLKWLAGQFSTHTAATGASVHGLGTIATQAADNAAITGGYALLTYEREAVVALGSITGSTSVNWQAGGLFTVTVGGSGATLTWQNLPNRAGYITIVVTNGGLATSLFTAKKVGGVALSWTNPGVDIVTLRCFNGSDVYVCGFEKDTK